MPGTSRRRNCAARRRSPRASPPRTSGRSPPSPSPPSLSPARTRRTARRHTTPSQQRRPSIAPLGAPHLTAQLDALRTRFHAVNPAQAYGITAREADVLRYLVEGASNQEIADHLSISRRTVDQHVSSILGKLGVANRVAATSLALERGLVPAN